ncbi:MAG: endonuclease/exonuclease/phosphatase family protein [Gaiellales bacterium]
MSDSISSITTDRRIRIAGGGQLPGEVRLPELAGVQPANDPALDTVGRLLGDARLLAGSSVVGGAALGASLAGGGPLRRVGGVIGGAAAGVVGALLALRAMEMTNGRGSSSTTAYVADLPAASTTPRRGEHGESLTVMDWNVRDLIGPDGHIRSNDAAIDVIAETVAREQPDVLVLQEVGEGTIQGAMRNNLAELAERLGATDAVLVPNGRRAGGSAKGGAILTFGDAKIQDARGLRHADPGGDGTLRRIGAALGPLRLAGVDLPEWVPRGYMPRTTADAVVTTSGGNDVRVMGVHLSGAVDQDDDVDTIGRLQREQVGSLITSLDAWQGPTIIAGDFNIRDTSSSFTWEREHLGSAGMRDALTAAGIRPGDPARYSHPTPDPSKGIDRTYVSEHFDVATARVMHDDDAREGSDHLPTVIELTIR